jgi:sugar lactone lactonase YvrE
MKGSNDTVGTTPGLFSAPCGIALDGTALYVADTGNCLIRKISGATGATLPAAVSTYAGAAGVCNSVNATPLTNAHFALPYGLAINATHNMYITEYVGQTLRLINSMGMVSTVAGAPGVVGSTDSTTPTSARFWAPYGVAVDTRGNVYIAELGNDTIRKFSPVPITGATGSPGGPIAIT